MHSLLICTDDSALGRIDPTMLDDQTRMELLIDGLSDEAKKNYQDANGNYLEYQKWDGVYLGDDDIEIERFEIPFSTPGTVAFEFLPKSLTGFEASSSDIEGTVPVSLLPRGLVDFDISSNQNMFGTIDFCALPPALEMCDLSDNKFTGNADLTKLPKRLQSLHIRLNNFHGSVSLSYLPASLKVIDISYNEFSGRICEAKISDSLTDLYANHCKFTGSFVFENLPECREVIEMRDNEMSGNLHITEVAQQEEIDVSGNAFTGTAVVHSSMYGNFTIYGNRIEAVVDENGNEVECSVGKNGFVRSIRLC